MGDIKNTFLKKYGFWEYLLFLAGLIVLGRGTHILLLVDLDDMTWDVIWKSFTLIGFGALSMSRPMAITNIARKRFGAEPKK